VFYSKLNALRGVAALFVAVFHFCLPYENVVPLIANAAIFVDFFFILSGFVIYKSYRQPVHDGAIRFRQFAFLRFMRLYPVHFFIMLFWLAAIGSKFAAARFLGIGSTDLGYNTPWLFFENLFLINSYGISSEFGWNFPSWSISAELFAYLVFFIVFMPRGSSTGTRKSRPWRPFLFSAFCYLALYVAGLFQTHHDLAFRHSDFGFLRATAGFFIGVGIAGLDPGRSLEGRGVTVDTVLELLLLVIVVGRVSVSGADFGPQIVAVLSFAVAIAWFSGQSDGLVSRVLNSTAMQYFGHVSYSFYLWHIFAFLFSTEVAKLVFHAEINATEHVAGDAKWLVMIAAFLLTTGLSVFTYHLVEQPFRRWSKDYAARKWRGKPTASARPGLSL